MNTLNRKWIGQEFEDNETRKRFRRSLITALRNWRAGKRETSEVETPYWKSDFNDWLVYESTLLPCGCKVESITPQFVTFSAYCSGVSSEGICLDAEFVIPTSEFTRAQLKQMVHTFEYYPTSQSDKGVSYGPFTKTEYISRLTWWYDDSYDENK